LSCARSAAAVSAGIRRPRGWRSRRCGRRRWRCGPGAALLVEEDVAAERPVAAVCRSYSPRNTRLSSDQMTSCVCVSVNAIFIATVNRYREPAARC
jgi:hypothetical protein